MVGMNKQHYMLREDNSRLVNPHCSLLRHCCHFLEDSELPLYDLLLLLSKVECCPTAHEVKNTQ